MPAVLLKDAKNDRLSGWADLVDIFKIDLPSQHCITKMKEKSMRGAVFMSPMCRIPDDRKDV